MGMFDYVEYEMPCPDCGVLVDNFQSKDGPCVLDTVSPCDVQEFYTTCPGCGTWIALYATPALERKFTVTSSVGYPSKEAIVQDHGNVLIKRAEYSGERHA